MIQLRKATSVVVPMPGSKPKISTVSPGIEDLKMPTFGSCMGDPLEGVANCSNRRLMLT